MQTETQKPIIIEIPADATTRLLTLEEVSLTQSELIRTLTITDEDSYHAVVAQGRLVHTFISDVEVLKKRLCDPLSIPLDSLRASFKSILDLSTADKKFIAELVSQFEQAQKRAKEERQRLLDAENRRVQEQLRLDSAVKAEESGLSPTSVNRILDAPITTAAPVAPPTYQKAAGTAGREYWSAVPSPKDPICGEELAALRTLVQAAAKNDSLLCYLILDQSALNREATNKKTLFNVPGYEAQSRNSTSFRKV